MKLCIYNWIQNWTPILDTPLQYTKLNIFNFVIPEKTLQYVVSNFVSNYGGMHYFPGKTAKIWRKTPELELASVKL